MPMRLLLIAVCLVVIPAVLSACGSQPPPAATAPPSATSLPTPLATPPSQPLITPPTPFPLPSPTATRSAPPSPTAVAAENPEAIMSRVRMRVQMSSRILPPQEIITDVARAAMLFLDANIDLARPRDNERAALRYLQTLLTLDDSFPAEVDLADLDSDGQREAILTLGYPGLPIVVLRKEAAGFASYRLLAPPDAMPDGAFTWARSTIARIEDINGDGRTEIIVIDQAPGASASNSQLTVHQWSGDGFRVLLTVSYTDWAGEANWGLRPGQTGYDLYVYQPYLGVHDHKLLTHQVVTATYRWQADAYGAADRQLSSPTVQRHQVNVAEELFLKGDFAHAAAEFRKAIALKNLPPEESVQVDWTGYGWFRLGECYALLGRQEEARQAMNEAAKAGSTIGDLAAAFLTGYAGSDATTKALAAVSNVDLYERVYQGKGGNLDFPVDAGAVLYPAGAVLAFLSAHPDLATQPSADVAKALQGMGLRVTSALTADLNGDGQGEVAVILPAGRGDLGRLWLFGRVDGDWRAFAGETGTRLTIREAIGLRGGGGTCIVVESETQGQPRQALYGWDGQRVVPLDR